MDNQNQQKFDSNKPNNRVSGVLQTPDLNGAQEHFSPLRFLVITIGGIFLAEVVVMTFIYGFPNLPYYLQALMDASLMVILIFPIVYFFSLKPLLLHIEKHKLLEIALRQSKERFALAYRSNPAALSIIQVKTGRFIEVNESFLRLYGYARNEVIGFTSDELNLYPNLEERKKLEWLLLKQRAVAGFEMTTRIKSGEIRNISVSTEAIELDGEVNILAVASDITEQKQAEEKLRKAYDEIELRVQEQTAELRTANSELEDEINVRGQAEEALRKSEERYRQLVKYAPAAIYEMNMEGTKFLSVNEFMCDILMYSRDELLSMRPSDLLDEESRSMFAQRVGKKLAGDKIDEDVEYRVRRKDGVWLYTTIKVGAITFTNEDPPRVIVIGHDITERKQAEEKIQAVNEELMRFNNAMVGRELRMIELKKEVNALCAQIGQPRRYPLDFEKENYEIKNF
ncbi:MAG: PAS domain S-box protein [Chloroflexi bacterium]|nr:PAS domain S-box protein [Chloroflexota bacterium]